MLFQELLTLLIFVWIKQNVTEQVNDVKISNVLDYQYGIRLCSNIDSKILITFNARNEHDRSRFVEDLKEAILEVLDILLCVLTHILVIHNFVRL